MRALLWSLRLMAGLGLAALAYLLALWSGPDIEAALSPVIRHASVAAVERNDLSRSVCWTVHFDKVKPASPVDAGWTLRADGRIWPYQEIRTVADSEGMVGGLTPRPVAPGQWTRKCATIPPELTGRPFAVSGFVEFRTDATGALWTIRQPFGGFDVPADGTDLRGAQP